MVWLWLYGVNMEWWTKSLKKEKEKDIVQVFKSTVHESSKQVEEIIFYELNQWLTLLSTHLFLNSK